MGGVGSRFERLTLRHAGRDLAILGVLARGRMSIKAARAVLTPVQRRKLDAIKRESRAEEYAVSRWLLWRLRAFEAPFHAISHCPSHIAVAVSSHGALGLDIESRRPRREAEVAARLQWPPDHAIHGLQYWTLWEAWRKLEGGSVLDEPDPAYQRILGRAAEVRFATCEVAGGHWGSWDRGGAWLSLAVRP